jgi:hypothetical protein
MFVFVSSIFLILIFYMKSLPSFGSPTYACSFALQSNSTCMAEGNTSLPCQNTDWFNRVRFGANALLIGWIFWPLLLFTVITKWRKMNLRRFLISSTYAQLLIIIFGAGAWLLDTYKFNSILKSTYLPCQTLDLRTLLIILVYLLINLVAYNKVHIFPSNINIEDNILE